LLSRLPLAYSPPDMLLSTLLLASAIAFQPIESLPITRDPLAIERSAQHGLPFSIGGEYGSILGEQDGSFEVWIWPVKILSQFRIEAELDNYPAAIDVNALATTIETNPGRVCITYSHAGFTIRQHMVAFRGSALKPDEGAAVFFEIAAVRKLHVKFKFRPEVRRMWPASNFGIPSAEWMPEGYYVLHTDDPEAAAVIGMPRSQPGPLRPYQERPQAHPLELNLLFDPQRDSKLIFPLIMLLGDKEPLRRVASLNANLARLLSQTQDYYAHFFDDRTTSKTPDEQFDRALKWAQIAMDQGRVRHHGEEGLIAGLYESGDSARPGFGWFFGRDALWSSYALNGSGDFAFVRRALEFLIRRQRADGKIMHEYSQTSDLMDWKSTPYFYAAADSTPLFVMAMEDYVNTSGDVTFLKTHWEAVKRAYAFTRTHAGSNGIYTNEAGTGWVESWPSGMPYQEIYLASLDQQSAGSMARLSSIMKDAALARSAAEKAGQIRSGIESEFYLQDPGIYAFSRNRAGGLDKTATIFPSVAWWDGHFSLPKSDSMLSLWASKEFSTDWGVREVGANESVYDPLSYHQGSVWPLFTGWVSLAEYRAGRALAGYQHLMQNVDLTWAHDPGAVTELLSGAFFQPFGRSTAHQIWSSAMVLTPALRGLFGLDWDALKKTLRLAPHLPADWDEALLRNVHLGSSQFDLAYRREGQRLIVQVQGTNPVDICLEVKGIAQEGCLNQASIPLPEVEIGIPHGLPPPGAGTGQLKVVDEQFSERRYAITLEAPGSSVYEFKMRLNRSGVRVSGGELVSNRLRVEFPPGDGYQLKIIAFEW
jgi:glycogen debranching enzyme